MTAGGPGYVAVGTYTLRPPTPTQEPAAADRDHLDLGRWEDVGASPGRPGVQRRDLGQVIAWKGELLAYGCAGCGMESGPTTGWSSSDGVTWTRFTPTLPAGSEVVGS